MKLAPLLRRPADCPVVLTAALLPLLLALLLPARSSPAAPQADPPAPPPKAPDFTAALRHAQGFEIAPNIQLQLWAAEPQFKNAVAFSFNERGECFLAETHRYGVSVFDITQHLSWLTNDLSFRNIADREAFLTETLAPNAALLTRDSELVRKVTDSDGDGRADHSEVYASGFHSPVDGTAAGILALGDNVWFANIPHLWSIPAAPSATPESRPRSALARGFGVHIGVTGHDLHGLVRGPDGRLYFSSGDRGFCVTNREGRILNYPDTGAVLRCEPDGSRLEVFCVGLRNPQELAFDDLGNLWTVDNDTAGADPCRVLHLVHGADYGWRFSYQYTPNFSPWVAESLWTGRYDGLLPPAGQVSQGPAGLAWYPGTGWGNRFAGHFLHCDFPGGVWAFAVQPSGPSFQIASKEKILWKCWPTDVEFGPDGALYILDWVAGWQMPEKGRIYKLTPELSESDKRLAQETQRLLATPAASQSSGQLALALSHPNQKVRLVAQWELVQRGQTSLALLEEAAAKNTNRLARLHSVWALGAILRHAHVLPSRPESATALGRAQQTLRSLLTHDDIELAGQAALALAEARDTSLPEHIARLLSQPSPRAPFLAALALAQLQQSVPENATNIGPSSLDGLLETLSAAPSPWSVHAGTFLLKSGLAQGRLTEDWIRSASHADPTRRKMALLALRRLAETGAAEGLNRATPLAVTTNILQFLLDPDASIVTEAGRAIHGVPIVAALPALASFITKIDCPTNLMPRVIDACHRLGTQQHAQMVAGFAIRRDVPEWARALATRTLGSWAEPLPIDAVNGLWRPFVTIPKSAAASTTPAQAPPSDALLDRARDAAASLGRNLGRAAELPGFPPDLGRSASHETSARIQRNRAPALRAFLRSLPDLLDPSRPDESGLVLGGEPSPAIQLAAIDSAVRLQAREASEPLHQAFLHPKSTPEVRAAILRAFAELRSPHLPEAIRAAIESSQAPLREAAIPWLSFLEDGDSVALLQNLIPAPIRSVTPPQPLPDALRLAQAALRTLGRQSSPAAQQFLLDLLLAWRAGDLRPDLAADLIDAIRTQPETPAARQLAQSWPPPSANPLDRLRPALAGGNAARGRQLFESKAEIQCQRCHIVAAIGGTVGPRLDGIGNLKTREQLLESIVQPNAAFAPGYVPPPGSPSAMPEGLADLLTLSELRDLIEYLASLR